MFKLGDSVTVAGLDGCKVVGIIEREGGWFYEIKSVSNLSVYPASDVFGENEEIPEVEVISKHYSEVPDEPAVDVAAEKLEPQTTEDVPVKDDGLTVE